MLNYSLFFNLNSVIMKRIITSMILCLTVVAVSAQRYCSLDEIKSGWRNKTITGVKSGNIMPLLTAFNQTWRTEPGTALLKDGTNPARQDDEYHFVVDTPNGFASASELGDDGAAISACVWKRANGNKLFAVVVTKFHGLFPETKAFFYNYNPTRGTLTPETNEVTDFQPSFSGTYGVDAVTIKLPQHGKTVEIDEYIMGWGSSIKHSFVWNGMEPKWSRVDIDNYSRLTSLYTITEPDFSKYALIDVDEDNIPELWLFSENNDNQAIYSIVNDNVSLLASKYFKTNFSFFNSGANSVILSSGGCGTGCYNAEYTVVENSRVKYTLNDFQSWDYEKDKMVSSFSKNDKDISNAEGERLVKSFGEPVEIHPAIIMLRAR